jgi:hypothetical protein
MCESGDKAPLFLTSALHEGEWLASLPGHFSQGKELPVPIGKKAGWTPAGNRTPVVQLVARRYTD